jgi:hypothetical protein
LVPNVGATPGGTFYTVVYQLVYDRILNAVITVLISAAIAIHDRWGIK